VAFWPLDAVAEPTVKSAAPARNGSNDVITIARTMAAHSTSDPF
jgi:hypothetical protein